MNQILMYVIVTLHRYQVSDDAHFSDDNLILVSTNVEDEASADTNPLADDSNNEEDVLSPLNVNLIASTRKKRVFRAFGEDDDDDDDDEDVQKADTAPKDEDMDRKGDNNECHNVPLQKDLVSLTRKKQVFVDLEDDDDDDDDDDENDENVCIRYGHHR